MNRLAGLSSTARRGVRARERQIAMSHTQNGKPFFFLIKRSFEKI